MNAATKSLLGKRAATRNGGNPSSKRTVKGEVKTSNDKDLSSNSTVANSTTKAGILAMPDEILLRILSRVRDKVVGYSRIRATCRRFRDLVNTTDFFRTHWAFWFGGNILEIERRHILASARNSVPDWRKDEDIAEGKEACPLRISVDAARIARVDKERSLLGYQDYEAILRIHVKRWVGIMGRHFPFFSLSLNGNLIAGSKKNDRGRRIDIDKDLLNKIGVCFELSSSRLLPGSRTRWRINRPFEIELVRSLGLLLGYRNVVERADAKFARYGYRHKPVSNPEAGHLRFLDFIASSDLSYFMTYTSVFVNIDPLPVGILPSATYLEELLDAGRFDIADRVLVHVTKENVTKVLTGRPTWVALVSGDPLAVAWLLDRGVDLIMAKMNKPPLMWACKTADVVMLDALLDRLGLPSAADQAEMLRLAIYDAVRTKDTRKVESLLRRGVDPNSRIDKKKNPLRCVVNRIVTAPDRHLFQSLDVSKKTSRECLDETKKTICARLVEILLCAGADVEILFERWPNEDVIPPIHAAIQDVSLLRTLLCTTPGKGAKRTKSTAWVDPWWGFDRGCSIVQAIIPRETHSVVVLYWFVKLAGVQKGEGHRGVDRKDASGDTLLLTAVRDSNVWRTRELINMGASPNGVRDSPYPLSEAARFGSVDVLKLLMQYDVDPDGPADEAIGLGLPPPLVLAAMNLNHLCVKALLKGGANSNIRGADGWSPFWSCLFSRKRAEEERTSWVTLGGTPEGLEFESIADQETEICALLLAFDADPFLTPDSQDPIRLYCTLEASRTNQIVVRAEKLRQKRPFRERIVYDETFRRRCCILIDKKGWRRSLKPEGDMDLHRRWIAEIKGELVPDDE